MADHIAGTAPGCAVRPVKFRIGRELQPGEVSSTGLYAVNKLKTGWTLRVTLFRELADAWRDPSRVVTECQLVQID